MRQTMQKFLLGTFVCLGFLSWTHQAQAQVIWGREYERNFRPGTSIPYDGEPPTTTYGYATGGFLYPGFHADAGRLNYLDYADRLERAYKFGYQIPADPFKSPPPSSNCQPRIGVGFGYFRLR